MLNPNYISSKMVVCIFWDHKIVFAYVFHFWSRMQVMHINWIHSKFETQNPILSFQRKRDVNLIFGVLSIIRQVSLGKFITSKALCVRVNKPHLTE